MPRTSSSLTTTLSNRCVSLQRPDFFSAVNSQNLCGKSTLLVWRSYRMIRHLRSVRKIAQEISVAANGALDAYREDRVIEEPQITDRILGAIEDRIRFRSFGPYDENGSTDTIPASVAISNMPDDSVIRKRIHRVVWQARTLRTGRGIAAEEKRHGADLMGVLDLDLPGYRAKKGFLAQAKKAEPNLRFSTGNWDRLRSQCETMLRRTLESYVWVYSKSEGIRVFSATSVLGLGSKDIFDLYSRSVSSFFENHIECFFGDRRLNSTDIETLDALEELPIARIIELSARPSE